MSDLIKEIILSLVIIFLILFIVDLFIPTYGFFGKVDSGYVGIVTHFGKIEDRVLPAGFHVTGFFEKVHPVNVRTQIKTTELVAFSSDIQQVTLLVTINYNITPEIANTLFRTVGNDYVATLMLPRLNENVKVVVSNYTAEKLIASREILSGEVLELMKNDLDAYGITVSIENIDFTDAFEAAVESKQVATQEKQRAQTQQEQATMEAEQAAKRQKIEAEAAAEVERTKAEAMAYATRINAEAEAEANRQVAETITRELIEYVQAQNWDGKLPGTYASGGVLPIIGSTAETREESE